MRAGHFVHDDLLEHIEVFILLSHISYLWLIGYDVHFFLVLDVHISAFVNISSRYVGSRASDLRVGEW